MTYEGDSTTRVKVIEVDTGFNNNDSFTIIVMDPDLEADSVVIATQSGAAASDKDPDENELDHFIVNAVPCPEGGSMYLVLHPAYGVTLSGKYKINYMIG